MIWRSRKYGQFRCTTMAHHRNVENLKCPRRILHTRRPINVRKSIARRIKGLPKDPMDPNHWDAALTLVPSATHWHRDLYNHAGPIITVGHTTRPTDSPDDGRDAGQA